MPRGSFACNFEAPQLSTWRGGSDLVVSTLPTLSHPSPLVPANPRPSETLTPRLNGAAHHGAPADVTIRPTTLPTGFAAWSGTTQIGFIGVVKTGREWHLITFNVPEPLRNRGIGTRLLQAVLHTARCSGIRLITLHAARPAESLYRRFGFRHIEATGSKMYLQLPPQPPP
jgi:GNAT superfamily N-acetyltransferase